MMRAPIIVVATGLLLVAACSGPPDNPPPPAEEAVADVDWTELADGELTDEQQMQRQRALDAIQTMAGRLMGELTTALDEDGPTGAIEVCSHRAPEISAAVANETGIMIGRTSYRLRNPSNMAPDWAVPLVERRAAEPVWLAGPDGELAGLVPIRLKAECGMCHGPREEISDEVRATLDDFYPDDQAVGFSEGDLRGWFWVVAPAS